MLLLKLFAESGVVFDGTISLGSVLAGTMVALAIGGAAWTNNKKIALGLAKIDNVDERLKGLETQVADFPLVVQKMVDTKEELNDHETRLRALERGRAT